MKHIPDTIKKYKSRPHPLFYIILAGCYTISILFNGFNTLSLSGLGLMLLAGRFIASPQIILTPGTLRYRRSALLGFGNTGWHYRMTDIQAVSFRRPAGLLAQGQYLVVHLNDGSSHQYFLWNVKGHNMEQLQQDLQEMGIPLAASHGISHSL